MVYYREIGNIYCNILKLLFSLEKKIQIVYESFATKSFTDYFICLTNILLGLDKLGNLASVASLVLFTDGDKFTKGRRKKCVRFGWFVSLKEGGGGSRLLTTTYGQKLPLFVFASIRSRSLQIV